VYLSKDGCGVIHCKTHLGNILKVGDIALGYDFGNSNLNVEIGNTFGVFLVRKEVKRNRKWKIRSKNKRDKEYEYFVEDVENDNEMMENINVYDEKDNLIKNFKNMEV
jgi:pantothenate kinase type III